MLFKAQVTAFAVIKYLQVKTALICFILAQSWHLTLSFIACASLIAIDIS